MRRSVFHAPLSAALLALLSSHVSAENGASRSLDFTWTGLYGGVNVGYGYQDADWDFSSGGSTSTSDHSGVVGLQVGYDAQLQNNLFAGLEFSLDASRINGKSACLGGQTCEAHVSSLGDLSGRFGITSGPALYFLKAGVAYQDTTHHIESPGTDRDDGGGAVFGALGGAGIEYALSYNITTKIEYNYMYFGSKDSTVYPNTGISVSEPINLIKAGFNFKFD